MTLEKHAQGHTVSLDGNSSRLFRAERSPPPKVLDFTRKDMSGANLEGRSLAKAKLAGTNLSGARLGHADLQEADLFGANLAAADLQKANLSNAVMRGVNLKGANLNYATITGADFRGGVMMGAGGGRTGLDTSDLTDCLLEFATGSRAEFSGVDLSGASLIGADLSGANFFGTNLRNADLSHANLAGANLGETKLIGTKLIGANLKGAQIVNAIVENIVCLGTEFADAIVKGVDPQTLAANGPALLPPESFPLELRQALDGHAEWLQSSGRSGQRMVVNDAMLRYHDFRGRSLDGAGFPGCDLSGSDFSRASLLLANFRNAKLLGTKFDNARIHGSNFTGSNLRLSEFRATKAGAISIYDANGQDTGRRMKTDFSRADLIRAVLEDLDLNLCLADQAAR